MYFHPLQEEIGNLSEEDISKRIKELSRKVNTARPVSYTHLTLPTIYSV